MRKQFAANLRHHRDRVGLSQEALADICDLHRTEISLLERCKRLAAPPTVPPELLASRPSALQTPSPHAQLAQLVEHFHGKEGVSGSSPELGSQEKACKSA